MSRPKLKNQPLKFIKGFHIAGVLIKWFATSLENSGDFMLQKTKSRTHIPIIRPIPMTNMGVPTRFNLLFGKFPICGISNNTPINKNQWAKSMGSWFLHSPALKKIKIKNWPIVYRNKPSRKYHSYNFKFIFSTDCLFNSALKSIQRWLSRFVWCFNLPCNPLLEFPFSSGFL